jgi:hypothetical protein
MWLAALPSTVPVTRASSSSGGTVAAAWCSLAKPAADVGREGFDTGAWGGHPQGTHVSIAAPHARGGCKRACACTCACDVHVMGMDTNVHRASQTVLRSTWYISHAGHTCATRCVRGILRRTEYLFARASKCGWVLQIMHSRPPPPPRHVPMLRPAPGTRRVPLATSRAAPRQPCATLPPPRRWPGAGTPSGWHAAARCGPPPPGRGWVSPPRWRPGPRRRQHARPVWTPPGHKRGEGAFINLNVQPTRTSIRPLKHYQESRRCPKPHQQKQ